MKLCFDANVLVDIWGVTDDARDSFASLDVALMLGNEVFLSAGSIADIAYVLHARGHLDRKATRAAIGDMLEVFDLMDVIGADCHAAQASDMNDIEDAIVAAAAKREQIDFIITRNKRDFRHSPVPALTPHEYLSLYRPDGFEYDIVQT